ncbi:hypothetical protein BS47DRAFT_1337437 [Hydnum rufescens UP504]|uniref:Uncharacterized protein n=1 Tax=Hydnum rufescens UP504 TaxID=1448309 RepID=A0A9P6BAF2_9AGAM|nr:hypothetical protein BS47DRAFT_1337437 [Hydnum rufescens UP504]
MPPKLRADHTLYHLSPKDSGNDSPAGDAVVINPEISSGLPLPDVNRYPQPASRPELRGDARNARYYCFVNPYWKRDARRKYPQLSVVTQSELSELLLLSGPQQEAIGAPHNKATPPATASSTPSSRVPDLTQAIASITTTAKAYSATRLPPTPPTVNRWQPVRTADPPHDPKAYWPMAISDNNLHAYETLSVVSVDKFANT